MGHLGIHACTEPHEAQIIVWYLSFKTFRFVNIHVYNDCMSNACLNTPVPANPILRNKLHLLWGLELTW